MSSVKNDSGTNWNLILGCLAMEEITIDFATGNISGEEFKNLATQLEVGGPVRKLVKNYGVSYAKNSSRKALRRRSLLV